MSFTDEAKETEAGDSEGIFRANDEDRGIATNQWTSMRRGNYYDDINRPRLNKRLHSVPNFTEQEMDNAINAFFHEDPASQKTYTRILVENYFSKFNWYFPSKKMKNPPSLSKAYAYFEHITLPRKVSAGETAKHIQKRADPGENEVSTELYGFLSTRASTFIEWGLGIDQYFITLRIMALVFLIAGLIHVPNLNFYRSSEYSADKKVGISISLQGSAVCGTTEWVVCADCAEHRWTLQDDNPTIAFAPNPNDGSNTTLIERFACNGGNLPQGVVNWSCLLFLVVAMILTHLYLSAREVRFDEDKVTSSDYTVVVEDPPKDAFDPDEWRDFFSQFATKQVTAVTIALNNEVLLRKLILRRRHRDNLRVMLPKGTDMDDDDVLQIAVAQLVRERELEGRSWMTCILESTILPIPRLVLGWFLPPETLLERSLTLTEEIKEHLTEQYDVTKVFVTFEDEEGQRAALTALSVGKIDVFTNNTRKMPPSTLFRNRVLTVTETAEANAIRWLDLSASTLKITIMRVVNLLLTCAIVAICGVLVAWVRRDLGARWAGPLVSILNTLVPLVVKILMIFEPHHTEGAFQSSLYLKITLFRWVNTALLAKMITPWTATLGSDRSNILPSINSVMWAEFWLTPTLRILDLWGNVQKHYMAPRARTQDQMNRFFQGTPYNLGERYTDLTKVMFLCFFYSALYPTSFFFGTAILLIQYYADKFCLLRVWATNANLGSEVARFSRKYFFSGALLAYCIVSAYAWAGFPYDNLCTGKYNATATLGTYYNVTLSNGESNVPVTVTDNTVFSFCKQNWRGFDGFAFPPTSRIQSPITQWMTDSQERLTDLYGWTSVAAVAIYFVLYLATGTINFVLSWVRGVYESKGQEQHIDFSSDNDILGYVPQIKVNGFLFPFLACDIDKIDDSLIGWTDRGRPYDHHNLIFDVPWKGMPRKKNIAPLALQDDKLKDRVEPSPDRRPIFSTIKHYPPEWAKKLKEQ